jgi:hypothetical protein
MNYVLLMALNMVIVPENYNSAFEYFSGALT